MKKIHYIFLVLILFFNLDCDGGVCNDCHRCEPCSALGFLLLPESNAEVQIRNRTDIGDITFYIQNAVITVNTSQNSVVLPINTNTKGKYRLVASIGGELFNYSSFDFAGIINDGSFITTPGTIEKGKCNLFDGPSGTIIPDGCV
ncbi:hypothetical protein [Leptospira licerasiae]|uniref:hypothetical protein n=1 Tax=Leptospira licerasiae TaxID=447106 RepID=UPI00108466F1|nr:hypothetical protein [Leptospira licerasiae]TGM86778.1 hypothetical protein EHR05_17720 [Leptospira licerasiae]